MRKMVITMLVVKAKIKEVAKGYNVAGDFAEALDAAVQELVRKLQQEQKQIIEKP